MDKVTAEGIAINYTKSTDRQAQANAGAFLAQSDSPEAMEAVNNLMRDEDEYVRGTTLFAFLEAAPSGFAGARKMRSLPFSSITRLGWLALGVLITLFVVIIVAALGLRMVGPDAGWEPEFISAYATTMLVVIPIIIASRPTGLYPRPVSAFPLEMAYIAAAAAISGILATLFAISPVIERDLDSAITIGFITLIVCIAVRAGAAGVVILAGKRSASFITIFFGAALLGISAVVLTVPVVGQFDDASFISSGRLFLFGIFAILASSAGIAIVERSLPAQLKRAASNIGLRARQAVGVVFLVLAVSTIGIPVLDFISPSEVEESQPVFALNGEPSEFNETYELSANLGEPIEIQLMRPATIEARGELLSGGDIVALTYFPFGLDYRRTDGDPEPSVEEVSEVLDAPELGRLIFDQTAEPYQAFLCFARYSDEESCPDSHADIVGSEEESLIYENLLRSLGQRFGGSTLSNLDHPQRSETSSDGNNDLELDVSLMAKSALDDEQAEELIKWYRGLDTAQRRDTPTPDGKISDGQDLTADFVLSAVFVGNEEYPPGYWISERDGQAESGEAVFTEPTRVDVTGLPGILTDAGSSQDNLELAFFDDVNCTSLREATEMFRMLDLADDEETLCDKVVVASDLMDPQLQNFLNASISPAMIGQEASLQVGDIAITSIARYNLALGEPVEIVDVDSNRGTTLVSTFSSGRDGGRDGVTTVTTTSLIELNPLEGQSERDFLDSVLSVWRAINQDVERTSPLQKLSDSERRIVIDQFEQLLANGFGLVADTNLSAADATFIGLGTHIFNDFIGTDNGTNASYIDLGGSPNVRALSIRIVSKVGEVQPSVSLGQPSDFEEAGISWSKTIEFEEYNPQNMIVLTNSTQDQYLGVFNYGGPGTFEIDIDEIAIEDLVPGSYDFRARQPSIFRLPAPEAPKETSIFTSNLDEIDTVIDVYDSNDVLNTYDSDDDGGDGLASNLTVYQNSGQTLFVHVRDYDASESQGSYTLTVR